MSQNNLLFKTIIVLFLSFFALLFKLDTVDATILSVDDIIYKTTSSEGNCVEVVGYSLIDLENVVIPFSIRVDGVTYMIKGIGKGAFKNSRMTSVEIDVGVESIGDFSFQYCKKLNYVKFCECGKNLDYIGRGAFLGCENLKNIYIPEGVKDIEDSAFSESGIVSLSIPRNIIKIKPDLFSECNCLEEIVMGDEVKCIGAKAFFKCVKLKSIKFSSALDILEKECFCGCTGLTMVNLPNHVTKISWRAFASCGGLVCVNLPDSLKTIECRVFVGCRNLEEIRIPRQVSSIPCDIFFWCLSLKSVKLPPGINSIGSGAFMCCRNLSRIVIPEGVEEILPGTFKDCTSLSEVKLPNSLKHIRCMSFFGCSNLRSIEIPSNVKSIDELSFYECYSLRSIFIRGRMTFTSNIEIDGKTKVIVTNPMFLGQRCFNRKVYYAINYYLDGALLEEIEEPRFYTPGTGMEIVDYLRDGRIYTWVDKLGCIIKNIPIDKWGVISLYAKEVL